MDDIEDKVIDLLDDEVWLENAANDEFYRIFTDLRSMIKANINGNDQSLFIVAKDLCDYFEYIARETIQPTAKG